MTSSNKTITDRNELQTDMQEIPPRRAYEDTEQAQSIAIAVLAAGQSSRFGIGNKLLARFDEVPLIRQSALRALEAGGDPVIVVTGHMAENLAATIEDLPVQKVFNPDYSTGMSSSLKCAVSHIPLNCNGLLIHLADMPEITTEHIVTLINAFQAKGGQVVVRASANGKRGNPVILPRALFDSLFRLEGDVGARFLIESSGFPVLDVELGSAALADIDTIETLQSAGGTF